MEVIDLTHTIHDDIYIFPGDPVPSISPGLTHEKDYCHVDLLKLGSHTGTHIDAPYHFLKDGQRVENLCNLDKIRQRKGFSSFLPLKLKDSDGSPIRAVFMAGEKD